MRGRAQAAAAPLLAAVGRGLWGAWGAWATCRCVAVACSGHTTAISTCSSHARVGFVGGCTPPPHLCAGLGHAAQAGRGHGHNKGLHKCTWGPMAVCLGCIRATPGVGGQVACGRLRGAPPVGLHDLSFCQPHRAPHRAGPNGKMANNKKLLGAHQKCGAPSGIVGSANPGHMVGASPSPKGGGKGGPDSDAGGFGPSVGRCACHAHATPPPTLAGMPPAQWAVWGNVPLCGGMQWQWAQPPLMCHILLCLWAVGQNGC